jgi:hypothetical protein
LPVPGAGETKSVVAATIFFTPSGHFGSLEDVRKLLATCLLIVCVSPLRAQEQERKLIDRIVKPDMTLQNDAQNKKFDASGSFADKRAHVGTFYLQEKSNSKKFSGTRDFSAKQHDVRLFAGGQPATANISSRTVVPNSHYSTASASGLDQARDAKKRKETNDFAGNRPFLDQGKSQKSLSRKNPPLTIEQVRELLNKNK